ncbi:hypothetical protein [Flavobacterium faecale]|uniref:hypothetical protein n=1 Tax=Flavobacterium faecale TaxID=1355330 RepID=UPI003AB0E2C7
MGLLTKTELHYKDYSWTALAGDNPKISGAPDNTLLNRKEGYEILYFVNKFSETYNFKNKSSAHKVEKMIRNDVPSNIHSQINIKDWIVKNWNNTTFSN